MKTTKDENGDIKNIASSEDELYVICKRLSKLPASATLEETILMASYIIMLMENDS